MSANIRKDISVVREIEEARVAQGLSSYELSEKAGYSQAYWNNICRGTQRTVTMAVLTDFAQAVGLRLVLSLEPFGEAA